MLIFESIIVKSENLHFYTLSEQTFKIAIISNKRIKMKEKKKKKCDQWIKPWLE